MTPFTHVSRIPGLRATLAFAALAMVAMVARGCGRARQAGAGMITGALAVSGPQTTRPSEAAAQTAVRRPDQAPRRCGVFGDVVRVDATHYLVERAALEHALACPEVVARSARIIPVLTDGRPRGLRLYAIRPGSPAALLGLRNGDTVLAIDDLPVVGDPGELGPLTERGRRTHHALSIRRLSRDLTLSYTLVDRVRAVDPW